MFAVPVRAVGAAALFAFACVAQAADNPAVELAVTPSQAVAPGSVVTLTGTVRNTDKKPTSYHASFTISSDVCGYHDEYSLDFKLGSGQTRTASVNYTVPQCAGTYTINMVVTPPGSNVVKPVYFTVAAPQ